MPPPQDALLNIDKAAEYLGMSPLTLRNWVRDRQIEYVKIGRLVRFRRSTLDAKIADNTTPEGGKAA